MKPIFSFLPAILIVALVTPTRAGDSDKLQEARIQFQTVLAELESAFQQQRTGAITKYAASLTKGVDFFTRKGELDAAIRVKDEAKELEEHIREDRLEDFHPPPVRPGDPTELVQARRQFQREFADLEAAFFRTRSEAIRKHGQTLQKAVDAHTRNGELEAALALKKELEIVEKMFRESSLAESKALERHPDDPAPPDPVGPVETRNLRPGLVVGEYGRQPSQVKDKGFIKYNDLIRLEPVGEKRVIGHLTPWGYTQGKNAVAVGYLRIDEPGEYQFNSNSFYDRNALYIDNEDRPLCGYRDGEGAIKKITLKKGVARIISIGYVDARGSCRVRWKPPGAEGLGPIPRENLLHAPEDEGAR